MFKKLTKTIAAEAFWLALEAAETVAIHAAWELGLSRRMVAEAFALKAAELGWKCDYCKRAQGETFTTGVPGDDHGK